MHDNIINRGGRKCREKHKIDLSKKRTPHTEMSGAAIRGGTYGRLKNGSRYNYCELLEISS